MWNKKEYRHYIIWTKEVRTGPYMYHLIIKKNKSDGCFLGFVYNPFNYNQSDNLVEEAYDFETASSELERTFARMRSNREYLTGRNEVVFDSEKDILKIFIER